MLFLTYLHIRFTIYSKTLCILFLMCKFCELFNTAELFKKLQKCKSLKEKPLKIDRIHSKLYDILTYLSM